MWYGLTPDQRLLRDTTRALLNSRLPLSRVRELIDDEIGFDRRLWAAGAECGWLAMLVAEELGGGSVAGQGPVNAAVLAHEWGRAVAPGPLIPTNAVAAAIARFGSTEQKTELLSAVISGQHVAGWVTGAARPGSGGGSGLHAVARDGHIVLKGVAGPVQDAAATDLLLVAANSDTGPITVLVDPAVPGVRLRPLAGIDLARRWADIEFRDVPVVATLGADGQGAEVTEFVKQILLVLQAAETVGVVERGFALTVDYAKSRFAFGRPIGSYQALKHRLAEHRIHLEGSASITAYAAAEIGLQQTDAAIAARMANAYTGRHGTAILHDCVQLHGGIAMTWEYDLHLFLRRAISNEMTCGTPDEHYQWLVDQTIRTRRTDDRKDPSTKEDAA